MIRADPVSREASRNADWPIHSETGSEPGDKRAIQVQLAPIDCAGVRRVDASVGAGRHPGLPSVRQCVAPGRRRRGLHRHLDLTQQAG